MERRESGSIFDREANGLLTSAQWPVPAAAGKTGGRSFSSDDAGALESRSATPRRGDTHLRELTRTDGAAPTHLRARIRVIAQWEKHSAYCKTDRSICVGGSRAADDPQGRHLLCALLVVQRARSVLPRRKKVGNQGKAVS